MFPILYSFIFLLFGFSHWLLMAHSYFFFCQAVVGLIAYPGLSPNPFPDNNYRWPLLVAGAPALLCWYSPWLESREPQAQQAPTCDPDEQMPRIEDDTAAARGAAGGTRVGAAFRAREEAK
jgi:hypothetical protein